MVDSEGTGTRTPVVVFAVLARADGSDRSSEVARSKRGDSGRSDRRWCRSRNVWQAEGVDQFEGSLAFTLPTPPHLDRISIPGGVSPEGIAAVTRRKFDAVIEQMAADLLPALREERPELSPADISAAAKRVLRNEAAIPLHRIGYETHHAMSIKITQQQHSSKGFARRYRSMICDFMHLTGAAYCEIFTCDSWVDEAIGTSRTNRGMRRQLSVRGAGGQHAFVERLREQVDSVWGK